MSKVDELMALADAYKRSEYANGETQERVRDSFLAALTAALSAISAKDFEKSIIGSHNVLCWSYGHRHYQCAVREIERLQNEAVNRKEQK